MLASFWLTSLGWPAGRKQSAADASYIRGGPSVTFELHKSGHLYICFRVAAAPQFPLSNGAPSEEAGFLCAVTGGPAQTTLQGKALSFTWYPVKVNQEDVTWSLIFIYLPVGSFFLICFSVCLFATVPLSQCALYLTPNTSTFCFHLLEYWSSLILLSSSNFNQVNGCI